MGSVYAAAYAGQPTTAKLWTSDTGATCPAGAFEVLTQSTTDGGTISEAEPPNIDFTIIVP